MPNFPTLLEALQAEGGCCPAVAVMPSLRFVSTSQQWFNFIPPSPKVSLEQGAGDLPWMSERQIQVGRNGPHQGTVVRESYCGQVCWQQRTTVPLCSGLGLQQLEGILHGFHCQFRFIPTKASDLFNLEQIYSEMFTHRVSQSGGAGKEVTYNLFNSFFLVIFSSLLFKRTRSCA